jgi:hypothetical protein
MLGPAGPPGAAADLGKGEDVEPEMAPVADDDVPF